MADTIVEVPGVGRVSFPQGMSDDAITAAIKTKILPQSSGPMRAAPTADKPLDPGAKPGAPDSGGPNGERREWFQQPPMDKTNSQTVSEMPALDRNLRALNLGTRAAGRGVADVAGLPVDLLQAASNVATAGVNAGGRMIGHDPQIPPAQGLIGGSDSLKRVFGALADQVAPAPTNLTSKERLMDDIAEHGTSFMVPALAFSKAARVGLDAGKPSEMMNPLVKPYAQAIEAADGMKPGIGARYAAARPIIVDTAAGMGAGAGENMAPDTPLGKLMGNAGGGIAGATAMNVATAPMTLFKGLSNYFRQDPDLADKGVKATKRIGDMTARTMQGATDEPLAVAERIRGKQQEYRDAGISEPTAGLMSEDPGLIGLEKGLRVGPQAPKFATADARTRASAAENLGELKPNADPRVATDTADQTAAFVRGQATDADATAAKTAATVAEEGKSIGAAVPPPVNEATASTAIDKTVRQTLQEQRATKNALFDEAKDAGATVQRDIGPLQGAADAVRAEASKLAPDSKVLPQDFLAKIDAATGRATGEKVETGLLDLEGKPVVRQQPGENPSYRDIAGLRPALTDAIAKARAENQGAMVDALVKLKAEVEGEGTRIAADAAKPGAAPELTTLAEKIAAADANYKGTYAPNFVKGEGGAFRADIARDSTGTATQPSQTARRFLSTQESAADLAGIVKLAKNPEEAQKGVRDYLFGQIAKTTLDGDKVSELRLNKWATDNKGILEQYPEVAKEVRDLQSRVATNKVRGSAAEAAVARAKAGLGMTEKDIEQSGLGLMLGKDPHNAVEAAFASKDPERSVAAITKSLGGKDGKAPQAQAWKRAVADWVEAKVTNQNPASTTTGENPVSLAKLSKVDDRYDRALSQVFSPAEMNSMQMVRKAVTDLSRLSGVRSTAGSNTAEDVEHLVRNFEMFAKAREGVLKGGGTTRVLKLFMSNLGLMSEGIKVSDVMARAMRDPQLAAHLLERPVGKADRSLWNSRLNTLMGVAAAGREPEQKE